MQMDTSADSPIRLAATDPPARARRAPQARRRQEEQAVARAARGGPQRVQEPPPRVPPHRDQVRARPLDFETAKGPALTPPRALARSGQARTASARLVSAIAKFELEKGVWTELLPWLWNTANATTAAHREVALQTIFMLLDSIAIAPSQPGGNAQNQIPALLQLLSKTLADPESLAVRVWSIRSLGKLAEFVESGEDQEIVRRPVPSNRSLQRGRSLTRALARRPRSRTSSRASSRSSRQPSRPATSRRPRASSSSSRTSPSPCVHSLSLVRFERSAR